MELTKFFTIIIVYAILDTPYLFINAGKFKQAVKNITNGDTFTNRYWSGAVVYICLALGMYFLVLPNIKNETMVMDCIKFGGIFGLAANVTFDFTMHLMFKGWTLDLALMDSVWGAVLSSVTAMVCFWLFKKYFTK